MALRPAFRISTAARPVADSRSWRRSVFLRTSTRSSQAHPATTGRMPPSRRCRCSGDTQGCGELHPRGKLPAVHRAAIDACDGLDGLTDGLISDPTKCEFDPGVLACKGADDPGCLTQPQIAAARRIYAPIDPRTGQEVSTGLEPGSELHWDSVAGDRPHPMHNDLLRFVVFKDPNWDYRTLDVAKHLDLARRWTAEFAATSTDLKPFMNRGGKLLIYHGWEDQNIPPLSSVNYYQRLLKAMGKEQADSAVRLYMVPGMGHCGGGDGPNVFDMVAAGAVARARTRPRPSRFEDGGRTRPSHATAVPAPADRALQGIGQHRSGRELRVHGAVNATTRLVPKFRTPLGQQGHAQKAVRLGGLPASRCVAPALATNKSVPCSGLFEPFESGGPPGRPVEWPVGILGLTT